MSTLAELVLIAVGSAIVNNVVLSQFLGICPVSYTHLGEVVEGTVIDVKPDEIILNIGYKSDGIITRNEYTNCLLYTSQPDFPAQGAGKRGQVRGSACRGSACA